MIALFHYALQSALCLLLLYLPYQLLLRHERFFRLNRAVLLTIVVFALTAPLVPIKSPVTTPLRLDPPAVFMEEVTAGEATMPTAAPTEGQPTATVPAKGKALTLPVLLATVYLLGFVANVAVRLYALLRLQWRMRRRAVSVQKRSDGITIYIHPGDAPPYSWFRTIVISEDDSRACSEALLAHECAHIRFCHSADNVLVALCQCVQWFNPFVYLLADSLHDIHEYQVDQSLLTTQTVDATSYKMLLITKATGYAKSVALVNGFNRSNLRLRLWMMSAGRSSRWHLLKFAVLLPMTAFAVLTVARPQAHPAESAPQEEVAEASELPELSVPSAQSASSDSSDTADKSDKSDKPAPVLIEDTSASFYQAPQFPGGADALRAYIDNRLANLSDTPHRAYVKVFISDKGKVVDAQLMQPTDHPETDEQVLRAIRQMPRWIPGRQRGTPVATSYIIPVSY